MKMLMFDFRESEKAFFDSHKFQDIDITFIKEPLSDLSVLTEKQFEETDVISVFISSTLSAEVLKKFKNLRIIATRSTGYNHIDLKYCTDNHIAVFNVPEYGEKSVAQFTIGLIIATIRNLIPAYLDMNRHYVVHENYEGKNLESFTIGIFGSGAIGSMLAKMANFFNMKVLVCSYNTNDEITNFVEYVTKDELLARSDIISLHIPFIKENYHFLSAEDFKKMKDGITIINTARGELIDIVALYENLISGKVKAAALDVLECEYLVTAKDINENVNNLSRDCVVNALITQKLVALDNVIITPHIAYNTKESVEALLEQTFTNILNYYKGIYQNQVS